MPNKQQARTQRAYKSSTYQKRRKELLRENPVCHWCKRRPATEADHLIEVDRGGSEGPLVPSCKPCNARRGANYKAKKNSRKKNASPKKIEQEKKPKTFFETPPTLTPRPLVRISPKKQTEPVRGPVVEPRLETIVRDPAGSYGDAVCKWAKKFLGVEVMAWQRHILRALLSYDVDGRWCNSKALVSVARQNGKTVLMKSVLGWYLSEHLAKEKQPQTIITTAHELVLAVSLFQDLAPILKEKFGAKIKWSYGRNELQIGPHRWLVRAATSSAGHGQSTALLLVDECWGVSQDALDVGLLPTQRAQKNPLCIMLSTAGVETSTAMLRWREQGLRGIDEGIDTGIYFAEYSPDPSQDPMTPEAWRMANPALGYTITEETLMVESMSPNRAAFLRSSCNLWVQSDVGWLAPGQFAACAKGTTPLPGGVLCVEVSVDNGRYCAVRVNRTAGGVLCATVEFIADTMAQTWQLLEKAAADPKLVIAVTPTLDVNCPLHLKRRRVIWGYQEVTRYTAAVRQMIIENKLEHTGETMLAEHVGRAVAARTNGSIALSSQRSNGPIELARCMVAAVGFAIGQREQQRPLIVTTAARRTA